MRRTDILASAFVSLLALASCDNEPNADFEKSMQDRETAKRGDAYAELDREPPEPLYYVRRRNEAERKALAAALAGSMAAQYSGLLSQLDSDEGVVKGGAEFRSCRPLFDAAVHFHAAEGEDARTVGAADALSKKLLTCREQTLAADGDEKTQATAKLLRRFASVGVTLVGLTLLSTGNDHGLALWRTGDELVAKDRPGFELTIDRLAG